MATEEQGERQKTHPPYVSFTTFKTCVADLKEHGLPTRIDRSVLTRFSGITGTQLMTALRFLRLMDPGGRPMPLLIDLIKAHGTDDWPGVLRTTLRTPYAEIFAIDLSAATPKEFSETFAKAFPGAESVLRKCIAFFIPAAQDSGVQISQRILSNKKPRNPNLAPKKRAPKPVSTPAASNLKKKKTAGEDDLDDGDAAQPDEFMTQLLAKFPAFDPSWPDPIKAEWFKGFQQFMAHSKKEDGK